MICRLGRGYLGFGVLGNESTTLDCRVHINRAVPRVST